MNRDTLNKALLAAGLAAMGVMLYWNVGRVDQLAPTVDGMRYVMHEQLVGDRVIHLPEDGHQWHTTLFLHDGWERIPFERELAAWFDADPRLASLKAQTHFHTYKESDRIYKGRFQATNPVLPGVMLQNAQGQVVLKLSGELLPAGPEALAQMVASAIAEATDGCPRPPKPSPTPGPYPPINPGPPVLPDVIPGGGGDGGEGAIPWETMLAAGAVAIGLSLLANVRRKTI